MFQYTIIQSMRYTMFHRVLPVLAVITAAGLAACATPSPQPITAAIAASTDLTSDDAQYAIATRNDRIGRIVVPVSINGRPDFHMMLDTGATHSVLTPEAAAKLGLSLIDAPTAIVQGVSGRMTARIVNVDQLQAGALKLQNLRVPVIDGSVVAGLDGILGVDGMSGKMITADFVRDRIRVADASSSPANSLYAVIKFALVSQRLVVADGMVGSIRVRAVIDTGGTQTLGNLELLQAINNRHKDQQGITSGVIDITDDLHNGRLMQVPSVKLGVADITNAAILFGDFSVFKIWGLDKRPTLLIGMDVLGQLGELSINYRRQELLIRPR